MFIVIENNSLTKGYYRSTLKLLLIEKKKLGWGSQG